MTKQHHVLSYSSQENAQLLWRLSEKDYIPALRRGVWVTRPPAPTPAFRGVPGTMTFEADPLESLLARASSCRLLAVLHAG